MEGDGLVFLQFGTAIFRIDGQGLNLSVVKEILYNNLKIADKDLYFTHNGRVISESDNIFTNTTQTKDRMASIHCHIRVLGGKGGFGSMLRALGAQIEKTTNREACRDLSGRRMRDVNNEKKIGDWMQKQKQEDEEKEKRKREKLERILNPPKHIVDDSSYVNEIKENANKVDSALKKGLEAATKSDQNTKSGSSGKKRNQASTAVKAKRQKMWLGLAESESSEESGDDEHLSTASDLVSPVEVMYKDDEKETKDQTQLTDANNSSTTENPARMNTTEQNLESKSETDVANGIKEKCKKDNMDDLIDLERFTTAEELEALGLERLKMELTRNDLKCGGTLQQRAQRLFLLKGKSIDQLDSSVLSKTGKKKFKAKEN